MAIPSVATPTARSGRARVGATRIEAVVAMLAVAMMLGVALASGGGPFDITTRTTIHVRPGDTLWEIAAAHRAPGKTTAETVEAIAELNGLDGELIEAGSVLAVPAPAPDPAAVAMR